MEIEEVLALTSKERKLMQKKKFMCKDQFGSIWKYTYEINGFIGKLPGYVYDTELRSFMLLYQVDSNGALYIIQTIYVVKIITQAHKMIIVYKQHELDANLDYYIVPRLKWHHIGLTSLQSPSLLKRLRTRLSRA